LLVEENRKKKLSIHLCVDKIMHNVHIIHQIQKGKGKNKFYLLDWNSL